MRKTLRPVILLGIACVLLSSCGKEKTPWEQAKERIMPQLIPVENKTLIPLVIKPFLPDVDIGFVIDREERYDFVDPGYLEQWGIDEDTLAEAAMQNLEERSKNLSLEVARLGDSKDPKDTYVIVELADGFSAVRLLSSRVRDAVKRELGDEYIAAIPHRDFLIFWHPSFPLGSQFLQQARKEYEEAKKYKLSPELVLVKREGMQQLKVTEK